jgi:hypothetical protein
MVRNDESNAVSGLRTVCCKTYVTVGIKESMDTATTALALSRFFENARLALL